MDHWFAKEKLEIWIDLFTNLAAGFIGSVIIFPGIFGIKVITDVLAILTVNLPLGILCLWLAFRIREEIHERD